MSDSHTFVITAKVENGLRVLQKIASLMTRKQLTAIEINIAQSSHPLESFLTLTLQAKEKDIEWLMNQLKNFFDLFDLSIFKSKKEDLNEFFGRKASSSRPIFSDKG